MNVPDCYSCGAKFTSFRGKRDHICPPREPEQTNNLPRRRPNGKVQALFAIAAALGANYPTY